MVLYFIIYNRTTENKLNDWQAMYPNNIVKKIITSVIMHIILQYNNCKVSNHIKYKYLIIFLDYTLFIIAQYNF